MQAAVPVAAGYWDHFKILNGNNCVSHREHIPTSGHESPGAPASTDTQSLELLDSGISINTRLLILYAKGHKS